MEKIYFDPSINRWYVKDLSDFYSIGYRNTVDEKAGILNWTKDSKREEQIKEEMGIKTGDLRLYVVEAENRKFHFLLKYEPDFGRFFVSPLNDYELQFFKKETDYEFVGEIEKKDN
jgi:hypothetical protein